VYSRADSVGLADDGAITIVGDVSYDTGSEYDSIMAIVRLNRDGVVDEGFGRFGVQQFWQPSSQLIDVHSVDYGGDGTFTVASLRYQRDGSQTIPIPQLTKFDAKGHFASDFGAPAAGTENTFDYVQGHPVEAIAPKLAIADTELAASRSNYAGASLTLSRHGGANAADSFGGTGPLQIKDGAALVDGVRIGDVTSTQGTLRIAFGAQASQALVNKALQSIGYDYKGTLTQAEQVQMDWVFSDGNTGLQGAGGALAARFTTKLNLSKAELPYWIDALLARDHAGQSGADFAQVQNLLLGTNHALGLVFDTHAGTALTSAQKTVVQDAFRQLAAVADLHLDSQALPVSVQLRGDQGTSTVSTELSAKGTGLYAAFGADSHANTSDILRAFGHLLGLDNTPGSASLMGGSADLGQLDIAALQYLYGPSTTVRTGDDLYTLSTTASNFIWDGKGKDTISAEGLKQDVTISLTPGEWGFIGSKGSSIDAPGQVTVNYGSEIENAIGGDGNDSIAGTAAANKLSGGAGKDYLAGKGGGDTLDGGSGIDHAVFEGARSQYTLKMGSGGQFTVQREGETTVDTLVNVERVSFGDQEIAIDIGGNAGQIYRLYQAAFDRAPDLSGLGYWIKVADSGESMQNIAKGFIDSAEFHTKYGTAPDNGVFLTKLYANVLHRAPDEAGFIWWKEKLDTKAASFTEVLLGFSESGENYAQVIGQIDHGIGFTPYGG
jgi:hypothetical protein